ncbi:MAG: hypothetical protein IH977_10340 [Nitrospinae bacterium]|nr:hypothetical protein [Nitrospinota bacterium]
MLKRSASFVLAAPGDSTYQKEYARRLASSLAEATLDGPFDHSSGWTNAVPDLLSAVLSRCPYGFSPTV